MDLPAWREENLAKRLEENDKKIEIEPWPSRMEREKLKNLFEKVFDSTENLFLKNFSYDLRLIEILGSIDWTRQRLT